MLMRRNRTKSNILSPCLKENHSLTFSHSTEQLDRGLTRQLSQLSYHGSFLQTNKIIPQQALPRQKTATLKKKYILTRSVTGVDPSPSPYLSPIIRRKSNSKHSPPQQKPKVKTKIYLSNQQSESQLECGGRFPGAPPATPTIDQTSSCEYILSLHDIRGQRSLNEQLSKLRAKDLKKLDKKKQEEELSNRQQQKEIERELKRCQRNMIYALNKVMTDFENKKFQEFKKEHELDG